MSRDCLIYQRETSRYSLPAEKKKKKEEMEPLLMIKEISFCDTNFSSNIKRMKIPLCKY